MFVSWGILGYPCLSLEKSYLATVAHSLFVSVCRLHMGNGILLCWKLVNQAGIADGSGSREPNQCGSGSWSDFAVTKSCIWHEKCRVLSVGNIS